MKRIFLTLLVALMLVVSVTAVPVQAVAMTPDVAGVYSSDYLSSYNSFASKVGSGKMDITFKVVGTLPSTSIGVSKINIYKVSGEKVDTIYGSTANGLQDTGTSTHIGSYTYYGTPGTTYYAEVTVFAARSTGSDSRLIITNSVTL